MLKKKAITIIASTETFANLSTFKDISELNEATREHKERYTPELNNNAIRVLDALQRYSAKYKGVSFRTKNNIAADLNISRRTVIRACKRLEELGIIKQYEMKRKTDMQQTSNAIVIQPFVNEYNDIVTQEKQNNGKSCHTNKTKSSSLRQEILKERKEQRLDHTFIFDNKFKNFTNTIKDFYNDYSTIKEFIKAIKQNSHKYKKLNGYRNANLESQNVIDIDIENIATDALKRTIGAIKQKKHRANNIKNPIGLFVKILRECMRASFLQLA